MSQWIVNERQLNNPNAKLHLLSGMRPNESEATYCGKVWRSSRIITAPNPPETLKCPTCRLYEEAFHKKQERTDGSV